VYSDSNLDVEVVTETPETNNSAGFHMPTDSLSHSAHHRNRINRFGCRAQYEPPPLRWIQHRLITASPRKGTFLDGRNVRLMRRKLGITLRSSAGLRDLALKRWPQTNAAKDPLADSKMDWALSGDLEGEYV
jgi:hypothetical protein